MKIVRFIGGLGNQMFQYAFYKALKQRFSAVKADISAYDKYSASYSNGFELQTIFGLSLDFTSKDENDRYSKPEKRSLVRSIARNFKKNQPEYFTEVPGVIDLSVLYKDSPGYYNGFWQSEKYFTAVRETIKSDFSQWPELDEKNEQVRNLIHSTESVAVHVRRGDYIDTVFDKICTTDYYLKAVEQLENVIKRTPTYFIFSNDINWCRENINFPNQVFISSNNAKNSYKDMQLMSLCKHNIIANSSFSWWSAWLNANEEKKVLCPGKWCHVPNIDFSDLLPSSWLKIY
jgi:hypothetical protein